ncbi:MAG: phosphodiesterase, partial [Comamonadaceae bacterium]
MSTTPTAASERLLDNEYEDLLGLWSDLESALSVLLARPLQVQDFTAKVRQCDRWLQDLVAHDIDAALYLMFQLAATSSVGYSTSHALVCGTLCHILAHELELPPHERDSLVRAAFTMNIGMTALQDELAHQRDRPTPTQQQAIESHPSLGVDMLEQLEVRDDLWLDVVGQHHAPPTERVSEPA